ncbi:MAG TPA: protein kinase [Thermoanaerobaculia bacterium]|nr:protein kinase [Thermoanaerobaculia bacterium]
MTDIPEFIDRFQVTRILGKGGMGTVYLARDERLGRSVAIKLLNTDEGLSEETRIRFLRESRTAASIRQQNVATIYEVGETGGQPFIVMEYCEGETLAQRLRRRPLEAGEFLNIARQIAAGLAAAHEAGVIHRDIKTANIIIEPNGLVKILDFGLAKLLQREMGREKPSFASTSGQFFGTLHFLSPEQARGGAADERSDLFSVGVVLYQMASGQLPFNGDGPLLVLEKIRDAEPEPFVPLDSAFPTAAARIISKLLQKSPADRYQNARELLHDLEAIDMPGRLSSQHTRSMLGRTVHRRAGLRATIAAAALLVVGTVAYLVHRYQPAPAPQQPAAPNTPIRSMAVLPLDNIANNTRDEFLSVGLADALVTKLQGIQSLQVRPTSAVLEFRSKKVDPKSAREKLQVDGILEGHFLAAGDLVRVNLQLTDTRTGYNVWADTIDGKRDNLLKLIDDVSARTVAGLNQRLALGTLQVRPHSEARSSNPQAFEQYLKARALTGSLVPKDYNAQITALRKAIQLDPNFAAAYADLAIAISLGIARDLERQDALEKAEFYARQAVRLDPDLPQAHLALGRVFVRYPDRFRESVREVLASLRLNPSDTHALNSLATYFVSAGDMQKLQCISDRIVLLDPSSNEAKIRGYWYINAVDPEGALQNSKYALASKDTELAGHDIRGVAFVLQGNVVGAEQEANALSTLFPKHYLGKSLRAMIAAAKGDRTASEAAIRSFEEEANRNHWAAIRVALCYAKLGDQQQAVAWTKRSFELGHHSWYELIKHPWFVPLQSNKDFQQLVAKVKADIDDVQDDVTGVYQLICK